MLMLKSSSSRRNNNNVDTTRMTTITTTATTTAVHSCNNFFPCTPAAVQFGTAWTLKRHFLLGLAALLVFSAIFNGAPGSNSGIVGFNVAPATASAAAVYLSNYPFVNGGMFGKRAPLAYPGFGSALSRMQWSKRPYASNAYNSDSRYVNGPAFRQDLFYQGGMFGKRSAPPMMLQSQVAAAGKSTMPEVSENMSNGNFMDNSSPDFHF